MSNTKKKYKSTRKQNGKSLKKGGTQSLKTQSQIINKQINKLEDVLKTLCNYEVIIYHKGNIKNIFYDEYGVTRQQCMTYKRIINHFFPQEETEPLIKETEILYDLPTQEVIVAPEPEKKIMKEEVREKIKKTIPKLESIQKELPPRSEINPKLIPKYNVLVKIIKTILDKLLTLSKK